MYSIRAHTYGLGGTSKRKTDRDYKPRSKIAGENSGNAVLTWDSVREIRAALASGQRPSVIAMRYGVSRTTISMIKHGHTWQEENK